ncbi:MAG TPA: hypothetical protein VGI64_08870 [Streptosporangiaceae bacterium]|jgi:hypothetical protein
MAKKKAGFRHLTAKADAMAGNRARRAARRERAAGRGILRMPGLRWVPVPLAGLAAMIGVLVVGSFQGQAAEANAQRPPGYRAGGLSLSIDAMYWMSNDMTGLGPGQKGVRNGYSMPASEMPGIQPEGDNRLRVEVGLSNVTARVQRYSTTDFTLAGAGGKTWKVDSQGLSVMAASAALAPGFQSTVDVYFDIPAQSSKHLTLKWTRDGTTVSIPVSTGSASSSGMHM